MNLIKNNYIHLFIRSISTAPLQGDNSEALPIPVRDVNRKPEIRFSVLKPKSGFRF